MKKLLITLAAISISLTAFADGVVTQTTTEKTTTVSFDSTKMKCGDRHINDGVNKNSLKKCKDFQDKKTDIVFIDDNSHKNVECQINQKGAISLAKCTTV